MKIHSAFFSATNTTKTIITALVRDLHSETRTYNLFSQPLREDVQIAAEDVLVVGMPVYSGRIPTVAVESLRRFKGCHTPVVLVAVYGNREFDDIFVEMQDILEPNGFFVLAAGAFIAQHSVFPKTAGGRPDAEDFEKIHEFSCLCKTLYEKGFNSFTTSIILPGKRPYHKPGKIPLKLTTDSSCSKCMACVKSCPTEAISFDNPSDIDYTKCIHCGHCIAICPIHARYYSGCIYEFAASIFGWKNRKRKEPQFFY